ncbi:two-component system sensor histidine kinase NtrB [Neobacillus sp. LXY-4]|uniref:two-component system sensor histidine kinase NtrB n=1 Tax=Neobacillus sp. LXY-4 TaxID=3379826 RepID=UPI003EE01D52
MKNKLGFKLLIVLLVVVISGLHIYYSISASSTLHQFFKLLLFIPIILASFQFGFRGGTVTALVISIIYSPQKLLSFSFKGEAVSELLDILLFFAIGIITGILVERKNLAINTIDNQLKKYVILENYSNSIFESISNGIVSINEDYFITSLNTGAKNILGVTNDCIGTNFMELFPTGKDFEKIIFTAMEKGEPIKNIEKNLSINDKEITIEIGAYPLSLEKKNKGLVIILEDITEIKKIKDQMQRNDKLATVGELATGIAHEIRNPLAIIKMIEQTMRSELKENKDAILELKVIDEEVERANKVIKSLMEFGKPSKNEKNSYCLNEIIEDVQIIVNKYTMQHLVKIDFEKGEIPNANVDKEQLKQAFVNLIFNAVDAMPQGGELLISTEYLPEKWIKVVFQDNGEGIAEDNMEKIYSPFFTTKDEGTGLGLSIVHRIIEDHGGIIKVTSKLGKGTRFELLFPTEDDSLFNNHGAQI